ncbi:DUF4424 family protein [Camelimonas abortus]|uniref:DUF4424 family protein n=1 Tax=Camelimonas abortus TaxID=1017184 RepID=A0ABV7LF53_9HYPH
MMSVAVLRPRSRRARRRVRARTSLAALAATAPLALAAPAAADDPAGEARIGLPMRTLFVTRPPQVRLAEADIVVTPTEVRGRYVFRNEAGRDLGAIAAFAAPDLDASAPRFGYTAVPASESLNFMDFSATVDGRPVTPLGAHQAYGAGPERTHLLEDFQIPAQPAASATWKALQELKPSAVNDLYVAGLVDMEQAGDRLEVRPRWLLRSVWYWPQAFPAGRETVIAWRHRVSAPAAARPLPPAGETAPRHARHCAGAAAKTVADAARRNGPGRDWMREQTLRLQLLAGPAWAGPADVFTVTIDGGDSGFVAASCLPGLEPAGPAQWRARRENAPVDGLLEVMFLAPGHVASDGAPPDEADADAAGAE